ncbi:MAG: thioesterase domain-containing protein [Proteobacteria bacterium]|nr:thioesterase domain-containing protein [Pseudomonadota bacterium]
MIEEKYRVLAEAAIESVPGIKRTGIRVLDLRERYLKILMPLEGNINHVGMMYAGSLFTLGELPGGVIIMVSYEPGKFVPIVKEVGIRFRRPALTDVTLELEWTKEHADKIEAEALEKGKADFTLDMELKDAGGEAVALVNGIWQIRPMPQGMANPFK